MDPSVVYDNMGFLLKGLRFTISISILSMVLGLLIGLLVALARLSPYGIIRGPAYFYTELFRTLPLLILLYWFHWGLPILTGITLAAFTSAVLAFSLNIGAFQAEAYRAGILSISPAQREAGLALGMTYTQVMKRIVLPQAIARIIPVTGSIWVSLFKDTALVSVIAVPDLMYQGRIIALTAFRPLEILSAVALIYLALVYPQARIVNRLYRRYLPEGI